MWSSQPRSRADHALLGHWGGLPLLGAGTPHGRNYSVSVHHYSHIAEDITSWVMSLSGSVSLRAELMPRRRRAGRFSAGSLAPSRVVLELAGGGGGGQEVRRLDDVHGEASVGEGAGDQRGNAAGGELLGGGWQGHRERRAAADGVAGAGKLARDGGGTHLGSGGGSGDAARVGGSGQELWRIECAFRGARGHDVARGWGSAHER